MMWLKKLTRLGYQNVTGYHLKSARKSLNILLQEWGNRGLHYWEVDETNVDLVQGQSDYDFLDQVVMDQVQHSPTTIFMVYLIYWKHN